MRPLSPRSSFIHWPVCAHWFEMNMPCHYCNQNTIQIMQTPSGADLFPLLVIVDVVQEHSSYCSLLPVEVCYITQMAHRKLIVRCAFGHAFQIIPLSPAQPTGVNILSYHHYLSIRSFFSFYISLPLLRSGNVSLRKSVVQTHHA